MPVIGKAKADSNKKQKDGTGGYPKPPLPTLVLLDPDYQCHCYETAAAQAEEEPVEEIRQSIIPGRKLVAAVCRKTRLQPAYAQGHDVESRVEHGGFCC